MNSTGAMFWRDVLVLRVYVHQQHRIALEARMSRRQRREGLQEQASVEGARTVMQQEMLEVRWRTEGKNEDEIRREVAALYGSGTFKRPAKPSLT